MKKPELGSNKLQSFIDFFTTLGKYRLGVEGTSLYIETDSGKTKLFDASGNNTPPAITTGDVLVTSVKMATKLGTTPVGTVVIEETGDGRNMITKLTLTDFIVGALVGAGAALGIGNIVYAFPAGAHIENGAYFNLSLKAAGTVVATKLGLGSVIATGAIATLATATFQDRLTGQTVSTDPAGGTAVEALANTTAGVQTGIALNVAASVKNVFLNAAGTWIADNTGNLTATGTIVLRWTKMSA